MKKPDSLITKFNRALLLQGGLIAVAALLSVFLATIVIDKVLINQAIKQEADHFWEQYRMDSDFSLPNTSNLMGYFDRDRLLEHYQVDPNIEPGFREFETRYGSYILYTTQDAGQVLYLVYNRGEVDKLIAYYGLAPLAFVLVVLYLSMWLAYRFGHQALSPITWLANQVNRVDFNSADFSAVSRENLPDNIDDDIRVLSDAIADLGERLEAFITRERNFTRDASHELRTPLTVIKIATDMMLSEQELEPPVKNSVIRIKRALSDMEELINVFLLLARESDQGLPREAVDLNTVVEEEIERAGIFIEDKPLQINFRDHARVKLYAPEKVLSILIGNIIRNAILYTREGTVNITLTSNSVVVEDSGEGISEKDLKEIFEPYHRGSSDSRGHGLGLNIVGRLSERFNWRIDVNSRIGMGTRIEIRFPETEA
jgi:signal transduction histidine kinase